MQRSPMALVAGRRLLLLVVPVLATVQFVWFYFWFSTSFVDINQYEFGHERLPFQGRCLMVPLLRVVHGSGLLLRVGSIFNRYPYWFPARATPELFVQVLVSLLSVGVAGWFTCKLYWASSQRKAIGALIYPVFLVACGITYELHTVQNFRYPYDLPALAFFSVAFYMMYTRVKWIYFALLFTVATINRETTLLLAFLYALDRWGDRDPGEAAGRSLLRACMPVLPLLLIWAAWQIALRHLFAGNPSVLDSRFWLNIKSLISPQAWPQLLTACGYLIPAVLAYNTDVGDRRIRSWLWIFPVWFVFQFTFGIIIETRVFGELIPLFVCASALIFESRIEAKLRPEQAANAG
jgi:hypothetical protein